MLGYLWRQAGGMILIPLTMIRRFRAHFYLGTAFIDPVCGAAGLDQCLREQRLYPATFRVALCPVSGPGDVLLWADAGGLFGTRNGAGHAMYLRCRGLREGRILLFHAFPPRRGGPSCPDAAGLCLANAAIVGRVFSLSGLGYLIVDQWWLGLAGDSCPVLGFGADTVVLFGHSGRSFTIWPEKRYAGRGRPGMRKAFFCGKAGLILPLLVLSASVPFGFLLAPQ